MASKLPRITVSIITRAIVSIVLLVLAIGVFRMLAGSRPEVPSVPHSEIAPQVLVMELRPIAVQRHWRGFGTTRAMDSANIPAQVGAIVEERPQEIQPGAHVKQGQMLVKLDDSDFVRQVEISTQAIADIDAQLAQLEVERDSWQQRVDLLAQETAFAQSEYERTKEALARNAAKDREVEQAGQRLATAQRAEVAAREEVNKIPSRRDRLQAMKAQQEASLKLAQQNEKRCTITSPIDGVLQSVSVEVGESVNNGQQVARVVSSRRIEIPIRLAASARREIHVGDEVTLRATGEAKLSWTAHVARIAPEDDESNRTLTIFAELLQEEGSAKPLAPGRFVEADVVSGDVRERIVVPRRALSSERIALVVDGVVRTQPISVAYHLDQTLPATGLPDEQWVVIDDEIEPGSFVVVNKAMSVTDGERVQPVLFTDADGKAEDAREHAMEATP